MKRNHIKQRHSPEGGDVVIDGGEGRVNVRRDVAQKPYVVFPERRSGATHPGHHRIQGLQSFVDSRNPCLDGFVVVGIPRGRIFWAHRNSRQRRRDRIDGGDVDVPGRRWTTEESVDPRDDNGGEAGPHWVHEGRDGRSRR